MLEIEDVADKDALFYFKDGLRDWARVELDRHNVHTLDDAVAAAESLNDYFSKDKKPNHGKSGGDKGGQKNGRDHKDDGNQRSFSGNSKKEKASSTQQDTTKPPKPCFICDGSHWTHDCPSRQAINALVTQAKEKQAKESQAEMDFVQHLRTLPFSPTKEEEKGRPKKAKHQESTKKILIDEGKSTSPKEPQPTCFKDVCTEQRDVKHIEIHKEHHPKGKDDVEIGMTRTYLDRDVHDRKK